MRVFLRSLLVALFLCGLILLFAIHLVAPGLPTVVGPPEVEWKRDFVWPGASVFRLTNRDGRVRVLSHDQEATHASARVRMYAREPGLTGDAARYAQTLFAVAQERDELRVVTEPQARPDPLELYVDYEVWVPPGVHVMIDNDNGNVSVARGVGQVSIHGRNADVRVYGPTGPVQVETLNGRIRAYDLPAGAQLTTVNGSIYAHMLGGALEAQTTNGAIVAHVLTPEVTGCRLTNQNGGVTVTLEEGCSAWVKADTQYGTVRCDLPVDTSQGAKERQRLIGAIGKGQAELHLTTLNGNVWITRGKSRGAQEPGGPVEAQQHPPDEE